MKLAMNKMNIIKEVVHIIQRCVILIKYFCWAVFLSVCVVLQWPDDKFRRLEDQVHIRFIKRLVFFFKPTNHIFSRVESDHALGRKLVVVGCQLTDFLVRCDHEEGVKQLMDLLTDIGLCLSEV